jgi:hypothetical protein
MNLSSEQPKGICKLPITSPCKLHLSRPHFRRLFGTERFANPNEPCLLPNRVRRTGRSEHSGARTAREDGGSLRETCWGNEGVIRRSIPGWSDDGASHRVNCDTPPLKGYCQGTLVPRSERY